MEGNKTEIAMKPDPVESQADFGGMLVLCDEMLDAMKERSEREFEAERLAKFGEKVLIVRTDKVLLSAEDYSSAFGLDFGGCKVFQNTISDGIFVKNPIGRGRYQMYEAILEEEGIGEALYVFHPSWVDYHPFVEQWKKKHHWRTMTPSEVQEARKKVRIESNDDSEQRAFFVFCVVLYALALLVSPSLIVTAVLTHDSSIAQVNTLLCAAASGILLPSADFGPRPNAIIGIIALIECPISLAFFVMIFAGLI